MRSKTLVTVGLAVVIGLSACSGAPEGSGAADDDLVARATAIHENVIALDTHVDIPSNFATEEVDPGVRGES